MFNIVYLKLNIKRPHHTVHKKWILSFDVAKKKNNHLFIF